MCKRILIGLFGLFGYLTGTANAATITFTIDTSALVADVADQTFGLDFYIENGALITSGLPGGPHTNPSNIVTISNFDYGGGFAYDPATDPGYLTFGGASGDIRTSVTLLNNRPDNELFQDFFPGSYLRFTVTYTNNVADSDLTDVFDFGITDSNFANLPTQGGFVFPSFLEIDFDSSDPFISTFASDPTSPTSAGEFLSIDAPVVTNAADVPEPSTFWLLGSVLLLLAFGKQVRQRVRRILPAAALGVFAVAMLCTPGMLAAPADNSEFFTSTYNGRLITYQVINGFAVVEGDMVIGEASIRMDRAGHRTGTIGKLYSQPQGGNLSSHENSVNLSSSLWPKVSGVVTIPYDFVKGDAVFMPAITEFNRLFAGQIHWIPRTKERNYVEINLDDQSSNSCYATRGFTGGKEILQGVARGCGLAANMHEMGHVIGFGHEQSRHDRDKYIFVDFNNLAPSARGAYSQDFSSSMDLGLYDYVSLMHYAPRGFSRNGNPDMESIPVGLPFGDPPTFSPGDFDAVKRLYFSAPTDITVTSNPAGLPIIVDGATYTAPQTFTWSMNSQHTLNVPPGPQTIGNSAYIFGRWNSDLNGDLNPSQTITVTPGSGLLGTPASSPAVTVYGVNFIELVKFTPTALLDNGTSTTAEAGSVSGTPSPTSFPGLPGQYFVNRAKVTLTATPAPGNNFYSYSGDNTFLQTFGPSTNPVTLPADLLTGTFYVSFASVPEVNIATNITDNNASGAKVVVDGGGSKPLPAAWALPNDSGWGAGTTHSLTAASPVSPVNDANTKYTFNNWTDAVTTPTRSITVPASGLLSLGVNYSTSYHVTANVNTACGGTLSVSSLPKDGFVPSGTPLTLTVTPTFPWLFAGWSGTVTGSANPLNTTANGEVVATANFNLSSTPLTVTSISPPSIALGSPAQSITITGTGFTPGTVFFLTSDYVSRDVTLVDANTITVALLASDFAAPGSLMTTVESQTPSCFLDVTGPSLVVHP